MEIKWLQRLINYSEVILNEVHYCEPWQLTISVIIMISKEEISGLSTQETIEIAKDLPKSAKTVFLALIKKGPMKSKELSKQTSLSSRTVRYGLEILRKHSLIRRIPDFNDLRSHFYKAQPGMNWALAY